jgi:hypothetical protein
VGILAVEKVLANKILGHAGSTAADTYRWDVINEQGLWFDVAA